MRKLFAEAQRQSKSRDVLVKALQSAGVQVSDPEDLLGIMEASLGALISDRLYRLHSSWQPRRFKVVAKTTDHDDWMDYEDDDDGFTHYFARVVYPSTVRASVVVTLDRKKYVKALADGIMDTMVTYDREKAMKAAGSKAVLAQAATLLKPLVRGWAEDYGFDLNSLSASPAAEAAANFADDEVEVREESDDPKAGTGGVQTMVLLKHYKGVEEELEVAGPWKVRVVMTFHMHLETLWPDDPGYGRLWDRGVLLSEVHANGRIKEKKMGKWTTVGDFADGEHVYNIDATYPDVDLNSDTLPSSYWQWGESSQAGCVNFYFDPYLHYGDYAETGSVGVANVRAFLEEFGDCDGVYSVYGGYGSHQVAIRLDVDNEEIIDALSAIADYPVFDEDLLSEVEMEAEDEAWDNWARDDFIAAVERQHDIDLDRFSDGEIFDLFLEAREAANEYWEHSGGGPWIDVNRVAAAVDPDDLR